MRLNKNMFHTHFIHEHEIEANELKADSIKKRISKVFSRFMSASRIAPVLVVVNASEIHKLILPFIGVHHNPSAANENHRHWVILPTKEAVDCLNQLWELSKKKSDDPVVWQDVVDLFNKFKKKNGHFNMVKDSIIEYHPISADEIEEMTEKLDSITSRIRTVEKRLMVEGFIGGISHWNELLELQVLIQDVKVIDEPSDIWWVILPTLECVDILNRLYRATTVEEVRFLMKQLVKG